MIFAKKIFLTVEYNRCKGNKLGIHESLGTLSASGPSYTYIFMLLTPISRKTSSVSMNSVNSSAELLTACLLLAAAVTMTSADYCSGTDCLCTKLASGGMRMKCSAANLTSIPILGSAITELEIVRSQITSIENNSFRAARAGLQKITLDFCNIDQIGGSAFAGLISLQELILRNNNIKSIPASGFVDLIYLQSLDLSYNLIHELSAESFIGLNNLRQLDLSCNSLSSIPPNAFMYLPSLRTLSLESNSLTRIPSSLFTNNSLLTTLALGKNKIAMIQEQAFRYTQGLMSLSLERNELNFLDGQIFSVLSQLSALNLRDNQFICDCRMAPFKLWLLTIQNRIQWSMEDSGACAMPEEIRGNYIANLRPEQFICPSTSSSSTMAMPTTAASQLSTVMIVAHNSSATTVHKDSITESSPPVMGGQAMVMDRIAEPILIGCLVGAACLISSIIIASVIYAKRRQRLRAHTVKYILKPDQSNHGTEPFHQPKNAFTQNSIQDTPKRPALLGSEHCLLRNEKEERFSRLEAEGCAYDSPNLRRSARDVSVHNGCGGSADGRSALGYYSNAPVSNSNAGYYHIRVPSTDSTLLEPPDLPPRKIDSKLYHIHDDLGAFHLSNHYQRNGSIEIFQYGLQPHGVPQKLLKQPAEISECSPLPEIDNHNHLDDQGHLKPYLPPKQRDKSHSKGPGEEGLYSREDEYNNCTYPAALYNGVVDQLECAADYQYNNCTYPAALYNGVEDQLECAADYQYTEAYQAYPGHEFDINGKYSSGSADSGVHSNSPPPFSPALTYDYTASEVTSSGAHKSDNSSHQLSLGEKKPRPESYV